MSNEGILKWNEQLQYVVGQVKEKKGWREPIDDQVSDDVIEEIPPPERREKGRVVLWSEMAAAEVYCRGEYGSDWLIEGNERCGSGGNGSHGDNG